MSACGGRSHQAAGGILDLRAWDPKSGLVRLDGEWKLQKSALLPADKKAGIDEIIVLPHGTYTDGFGCATMRLRILLPKGMDRIAVAANGQLSEHTIYVDDTLAAASGRPSCSLA